VGRLDFGSDQSRAKTCRPQKTDEVDAVYPAKCCKRDDVNAALTGFAFRDERSVRTEEFRDPLLRESSLLARRSQGFDQPSVITSVLSFPHPLSGLL
jgi:hypothetical protein